VIGAREREDTGQPRQRIGGERPEDTTALDRQPGLGGQYVVGPQVAPGPTGAASGKSAVSRAGSLRCWAFTPPCNALASVAPALVGASVVSIHRWSSSCRAAASKLSPSFGSAFMSPAMRNAEPGRRPPHRRNFTRTYVKAGGSPQPPPEQRTGNFWNAAARVRHDAAWHYVELPFGHSLQNEAPEVVAGLLQQLATNSDDDTAGEL
jgi:hypothetical protein